MLSYITRRLLLLPLVFLGLSILLFGMMQLLSPYQRLTAYVSDPVKLKAGDPEALIRKYGLADPLYLQYFRWINNIFHGNLGYSRTVSMPVGKAILRFFPATLELLLYSVIPVIFGAIWLGTYAATHHNRFVDHVIRFAAVTGWSLPTFVAGLFVLMVFYGIVNWFPPGRISTGFMSMISSGQIRTYTGLYTIDAILNLNPGFLLDSLKHLAGPILTISVVAWALILRITRSSMLETLRQDFVMTARAKGLAEKKVVKKHARRNALIPVATSSGLLIAGMLGGNVVVETVFDYKGLGWLAATAAQQLDFSTVIAIALFYSMLLVVVNLLVDLLYVLIDPRIRLR